MQPLIAKRDWVFEPRTAEQPNRWLRYARMCMSCPKDTARIAVSRFLLAWNTYIRSPKLR